QGPDTFLRTSSQLGADACAASSFWPHRPFRLLYVSTVTTKDLTGLVRAAKKLHPPIWCNSYDLRNRKSLRPWLVSSLANATSSFRHGELGGVGLGVAGLHLDCPYLYPEIKWRLPARTQPWRKEPQAKRLQCLPISPQYLDCRRMPH